MSVTDADKTDAQFRSALEVQQSESEDDELHLEEGDFVRVQDIHPAAPTRYPSARIGRVTHIRWGSVVIELLNGFGFQVTSLARKRSEMTGVPPRGF